MKKKEIISMGVMIIFILSLTARLAAQGESTLKLSSSRSDMELARSFSLSLAPASSESSTATVSKKPWLAGLEVLVINAGVWAWDRYVDKKSYSYISWKSVKENFKHPFIWDSDSFGTSFFGHPYHAAMYFNSARSLGLSFGESIPYTLGGYLMWGFFFENDPPSINDSIMSTAGGTFLGETQYRLSSQILDDSTTGGNRIFREILAAVINPTRFLNRLIFGDLSRQTSENGQLREPFRGTLTFNANFVSGGSALTALKFKPGIGFDFIYGMDASGISSSHPFDLIILNGAGYHGDKQTYFNLNSYALWFGKQYGREQGAKQLVGLFQHYDYFKNEIIHLSGTSLTGGWVSVFPLGNRWELSTSAQVGPMLFGGSNNRYTMVDGRDYNFGWGGVGKLDLWLSHPGLGTLTGRIGQYQIWSIKAATSGPDMSRDYTTYLNVKYALPLGGGLNIGLEYARYNRRFHFHGHPDYSLNQSQLGALISYSF